MSNSLTGPISTTVSSISCGSRADEAAPVAVIACGAVGGQIRQIAARRGWAVHVRNLPAGLHNTPGQIAPETARLATRLRRSGYRVALGYADCGTYGALDAICEQLGIARLPGLHCYDVLAGPDRIEALLSAEPGTYLLTDFLVRGFTRCVIEPLGLDRYPELWNDYFGHYRRVVWLAQSPRPSLAAKAREVAAMFGLPLTTIETGTARLEQALESLVTAPGPVIRGAGAPGSVMPAAGAAAPAATSYTRHPGRSASDGTAFASR